MLRFAGLTKFHFVLDKELLSKLNNEARFQRIKVSDLIDSILNKAYFLMEKADFVLKDILSEDFKEDKLVMDCDIKITMDRKFKYKLFNMQDHFHLRSKASLLRYILRLYFIKLKRWFRTEKSFGKDVLKRCFLMWERVKIRNTLRKFGCWDKIKLDHMDFFNESYTQYIYDSQNKLCRIIHQKLYTP